MRFGIGVRFAGVPFPLAASRTSFAARITAPSSWHALMSTTSAVGMKTSSRPAGRTSVSGKAVTRSRGAPALTSGAAPATPGYFNDQTSNTFTIQWDAVPTQAAEDAFSGLSFGPQTVVTGYACIVRFATTGNIDARNGGAYAATATVPYTANTSYRIRMVVRISNHTYDVFVTPQGQSEIALASNFAFRTEQNTISTIDYLSKFVTSGDVTLSNMIGPLPMALAPVVTGQTFSLTTTGGSFVAGEVIGTVTALYEPTSWSITAGDPSGNFAIAGSLTGDFNATVTVTSTGVSNLGGQTGTATLTVRATNATGNGTATVTVNYSGASSGLNIPMSWNDARYASNTTQSSGNGSLSGTVNNKDWKASGGPHGGGTAGDPGTECFDCSGTLTINQCRIDWREGPRLNGTFTMNECFLDIYGAPGDHADAMQGYQASANVTCTNCTIMTYTNATSPQGDASGAIFWADNSTGTIKWQNVLLLGGGASAAGNITIYADSGTTHVNFDHVYVVGTYPNSDGKAILDIRSTGGSMVIDQWNEVRQATISNGQIVPGALIPSP